MKALVNNIILCHSGHEMVYFMHLQVVSEYFTLVRLLPIHSKGTVVIFCIVQYLEFVHFCRDSLDPRLGFGWVLKSLTQTLEHLLLLHTNSVLIAISFRHLDSGIDYIWGKKMKIIKIMEYSDFMIQKNMRNKMSYMFHWKFIFMHK